MKTFLKDNIVELLAVLILLFTFTTEMFVIVEDTRVNPAIVAVLRTQETLVTLIVGYYFGSSRGSKSKQKKIDEMNEKLVG